MIGDYLVRRQRGAVLLSFVDAACKIVAPFRPDRESRNPAEPNSVLISQCGHLGDLILTLPTLRWLREHRPGIKIGLIVGSWANPMLHGIRDYYDHCYIVDHFMLNRSNESFSQKLAKHYASGRKALSEINEHGYDATFECNPWLPNNIPLLFATGIPKRIGFTSGGFGPLLTHRIKWTQAPRSFRDYLRDLLRVVFSDPSLEQPFKAFYPHPTTSQQIVPHPYIVLHPGAGKLINEWPEDHWKAVIRHLADAGIRVVIAGAGSREQERAERLSEDGLALNLCNKLSWDEFVTLIAQAQHVVCLDSSTSHLAAGLGTPSTVIMTGVNHLEQFGPSCSTAQILTFPTPCAPCYRSEGCEHMACLRFVTPADVINNVIERVGVANVSTTANHLQSDGRL